MAEVVLFHHAQGQTAGFLAFADALRSAGHTVHAPDVYDGKTFDTLDAGVAHAEQAIGFAEIIQRGERAAANLPADVVYAGFSLGVLPAQKLAQTRPGALGALLLHASIPLAEFGCAWPPGVALQMHVMEEDEWGDVDVARGLATTVEGAELFLYPGNRHLFTDSSLPYYDPEATALLMTRVLAFLRAIE